MLHTYTLSACIACHYTWSPDPRISDTSPREKLRRYFCDNPGGHWLAICIHMWHHFGNGECNRADFYISGWHAEVEREREEHKSGGQIYRGNKAEGQRRNKKWRQTKQKRGKQQKQRKPNKDKASRDSDLQGTDKNISMHLRQRIRRFLCLNKKAVSVGKLMYLCHRRENLQNLGKGSTGLKCFCLIMVDSWLIVNSG